MSGYIVLGQTKILIVNIHKIRDRHALFMYNMYNDDFPCTFRKKSMNS